MRATGEPSDSAYYWLTTRFDGVRMEILTVEGIGGALLPVFGSRRGARDFILSRRRPELWRARPTGTGELISVLVDARPGIERVVLDPSPKTLEGHWTGPVGRSREGFIDALLDGEKVRSDRNPDREAAGRPGIRAGDRAASLTASRT